MVSPNENDKTMLPISHASSSSSRTRPFTSRTHSVPLSHPTNETDNSSVVTLGYAGSLPSQRRPPLVPMSGPLSSSTRGPEPLFPRPAPPPTQKSSGYLGDLEEVNSSDNDGSLKYAHPLKSGKLGMCNDPYCTTCPSNYNPKASRLPNPTVFASTFHNALYDDARSWARRFASSVNRCLPGIMNPHSKAVQIWTKFFAVSSLLAIFMDPLFFFIILVQKNNKCIVIDWPNATAFVTVRTLTDAIFFANILLQFRLAYVARESTVVGAGQLVDCPKKIALHYFRGYFITDMIIVIPFPQQISTLAGNQVPSYFFGEVFFIMGIIGLGLLLFALLIGNMQNC